ncbi:MAG TPA: carboxylating nicotinate-nucleotide diphosphorylase [Dehalococcoidia bacterium]|nr:carboxylating nicotinate-nucleotide diphosphorylase [Dehalococcoidia bacterium]
MAELEISPSYLRRLAEQALLEDGAWQDVTTGALVSREQRGRAFIIAKEAGVLCGLPMAEAVLRALEPSLLFEPRLTDGAPLLPGQVVAVIEGHLSPILRAERTALNFLQRLSGIATATARLVEAIGDLPCRLRDTRKTTPGLRALERYAVRVGGGENHRFNLAEGILIKDNHLAALRTRGLEIAEAVRLVRQAAPHPMKVEVEVTMVTEAHEALAAGADELLLDNMSPAEMREVAALAHQQGVPVEASGGITLANIREVAETGVDYISVGAITHSAKALDLSLEVEVGGAWVASSMKLLTDQ